MTVSVDVFLPNHDVSTLVETWFGGVVVEMVIDRIAGGGFSKGRSLAARV